MTEPSSKLTAMMLCIRHHMSAPGQCHYLPPEELIDGDCIDFSKAADIDLASFPSPPRSMEELRSNPRHLRSSPGVKVETSGGPYTFPASVRPEKPTKIVLYYQWPRYKPLIKSALKQFGMYAAWVDGDTSPADRERIYAEFDKDELHHSDEGHLTPILVFSPVGAEGLNFPRANVMFILVSKICTAAIFIG